MILRDDLKRLLIELKLTKQFNTDPQFRLTIKMLNTYLNMTEQALFDLTPAAFKGEILNRIVQFIKDDLKTSIQLEELAKKYL